MIALFNYYSFTCLVLNVYCITCKLQLKVYAFQRSTSDGIHNEDIGFTLSEDNISFHAYHYSFSVATFDIMYYIYGYMSFGIVLSFTSLSIIMTITIYKSFLDYVNKMLINYHDYLMSIIIIGSFVLFSEFVATCVYIKGNPIPLFHVTIWLYMLIIYLYMLFMLCRLYLSRCDRKVLVTIIILHHLILYLGLVLFYALPAFLLLLVYPTKIIAIVAYLITYVFSASTICFILNSLFKKVRQSSHVDQLNGTPVSPCCIILYLSLFFLFLLFAFGMVFPLVYALVFGKLSAITAGPYTILSLIPSAAISFASWMLKTKMFGKTKYLQVDNNPESVPNHTSVHANSNEDTERAILLHGPMDDSERGTCSESNRNRRNIQAQDYGTIQ